MSAHGPDDDGSWWESTHYYVLVDPKGKQQPQHFSSEDAAWASVTGMLYSIELSSVFKAKGWTVVYINADKIRKEIAALQAKIA